MFAAAPAATCPRRDCRLPDKKRARSLIRYAPHSIDFGLKSTLGEIQALCQALALAKHGEDRLKAHADQDINHREKRGKQGRHDEHHNRGQQHFATGRPNNLGDFGAGLLDELKRVRAGHGFSSLVRSGGDIRRTGDEFKGPHSLL